MSYHPAKFGGHRQCGSRDITNYFSLSSDPITPCDQRDMWLCGQDPTKASYHQGGHRHSGSGYKFLVGLSRDLGMMTSPAPA